MTDEELAKWLEIDDAPNWRVIIDSITPSRRETYEHLARIEREIDDWIAGRGPRPSSVIFNFGRGQRQ